MSVGFDQQSLDKELQNQTFENDSFDYRSSTPQYFEWNGGNITMLVLLILFFIGFLILIILFAIQSNTTTYTMPDLSLKSLDEKLFESLKSSFTKPLVVEKKIIILYSYFESEATRKDNLTYFFKNGYFNVPNIDYLFILNGKYTVDIPKMSNILTLERENKGWDFGAWVDGLTALTQKYDYYIFLNDSCRGPFLINGLQGLDWIQIFCGLINDKVKLAGATINCEVTPHVQTYAWVTDHIGLDILLQNHIFDPITEEHVGQIILNREIGASKVILKNGFHINCMLNKYKYVLDWNDPMYKDCNHCMNPASGIMQYDGMNVHPLEVLFIKCKGPKLTRPIIEKYSHYHMQE